VASMLSSLLDQMVSWMENDSGENVAGLLRAEKGNLWTRAATRGQLYYYINNDQKMGSQGTVIEHSVVEARAF